MEAESGSSVGVRGFRLEFCLEVGRYRETKWVDVNYRLEADTSRLIKRVSFKHTRTNTTARGVLTFQFDKDTTTDVKCAQHNLYFRKQTRYDKNPMEFRLELIPEEVRSDDTTELPSLERFPVFGEPVHTFTAHYLDNVLCGTDGLCISELNLNASITNAVWRENELEIRIDNEQDIKLQMTVINVGEPSSNHSLVEIRYRPEDIEYTGQVHGTDNWSVDKIKGGVLMCKLMDRLGNSMQAKILLKFKINFALDIIAGGLRTNLTVKVNGTNIVQKLNLTLITGLIYPAMAGKVEPSELLLRQGNIGSSGNCSFQFDVHNKGKRSLRKAKLSIDWPILMNTDGTVSNPILYIVGEVANCRIPEVLKNFTKKTSCSGNKEKSLDQQLEQLKAYIAMGREWFCDSSEYSCPPQIECDIEKLEKDTNFAVVINASLCEDLFFELGDTDVSLTVTAKISLVPAEFERLQMGTNEVWNTLSVKIRPEDSQDNTWLIVWIILACIVGILILVGVVILLARFGFFRRNRINPREKGSLIQADEKETMMSSDYQ